MIKCAATMTTVWIVAKISHEGGAGQRRWHGGRRFRAAKEGVGSAKRNAVCHVSMNASSHRCCYAKVINRWRRDGRVACRAAGVLRRFRALVLRKYVVLVITKNARNVLVACDHLLNMFYPYWFIINLLIYITYS